ncbi:MAG: hypothetical protein N3B01_00145 [Verrucomicrobiae bacterium]|nr:hypothetical protein [Verrucomicrobiae bacterium]
MNGEPRIAYVGSYPYAVDASGRVSVPAKWRSKDKTQNDYCILPDPEGFLVAIPPPLLKKMIEKADDISFGEFRRRDALRNLVVGGHRTKCDKQGRIILTPELLRHAGITDKAVLVGVLNKFEIWSPERFAQKQQSTMQNILEAARELGV